MDTQSQSSNNKNKKKSNAGSLIIGVVFLFLALTSYTSKHYISAVVFLFLGLSFVWAFLYKPKSNDNKSYSNTHNLVSNAKNIQPTDNYTSQSSTVSTLVASDNSNNLSTYKKAIFLWWANKKVYPFVKSYPVYMTETYSMKNPARIHAEYVKSGLLIPGPKNDGKYVLSPKGEEFVLENSDFVEFHRNSIFMLDLSSFLKLKEKKPNASYYELAKEMINKDAASFSKKSKETQAILRNTYSNLYRLEFKYGSKDLAALNLLKTLSIDLSGDSISYISKYNDVDIPPGLVKPLIDLKDNISEEMFKEAYNLKTRFKYYDYEIFKKIIIDVIEKDDFKISDYFKYAKPLPKHLQGFFI